MSFANANSKFPRLLTMGDSDRDQHGGLAALPDEAPNGASAGDVDVADAPLGTLGFTPTGVIWQKIAMTTGIQWAPLSAPDFPGIFALAVEIDPDGEASATATWTAPFGGEIVEVYAEGMAAEDTGGQFAVDNTTQSTTPIAAFTIDAGLGVHVDSVITAAARGFAAGDVLTITYTKGTADIPSSRLWIYVRTQTDVITT